MMARPLTKDQAALLAQYAHAERTLIAYVARRLAKGLGRPGWVTAKQLELQATKRWVQGLLPSRQTAQAYAALVADAYKAVHGGGLVRAYDTQQAVLARIAHNTPMAPDFTRAAMRSLEDVYREVVALGSGDMALGVTDLRSAVKQTVEEFTTRGVTVFVDRAGRRWNISTYANMAVRTGTRNARRAAHLDRFAEMGVDLVKVSSSPGKSCDRCSKWEGKVLSIGGSTDGYPTLAEAEADGLHHPNCHHTLSAYLDGELARARVRLGLGNV